MHCARGTQLYCLRFIEFIQWFRDYFFIRARFGLLAQFSIICTPYTAQSIYYLLINLNNFDIRFCIFHFLCFSFAQDNCIWINSDSAAEKKYAHSSPCVWLGPFHSEHGWSYNYFCWWMANGNRNRRHNDFGPFFGY